MTMLFLLMLVITVPRAANATLLPYVDTYQAVACGGTYAPCNFTPFTRMPSASETAGLSSNLFLQYFQSQSIVGAVGPFTWSVKGSNDNGYIFGDVGGFNNITTEFVYYNGTVICCTLDFPFTLNGINNNNLMIGSFGGSIGAFVGFGQFALPLTILPDPQAGSPGAVPLGGGPPHISSFYGIDNQNRILVYDPASNPAVNFVLEPLPEPTGVVLAGSVIAMIALARWKRKKARA